MIRKLRSIALTAIAVSFLGCAKGPAQKDDLQPHPMTRGFREDFTKYASESRTPMLKNYPYTHSRLTMAGGNSVPIYVICLDGLEYFLVYGQAFSPRLSGVPPHGPVVCGEDS